MPVFLVTEYLKGGLEIILSKDIWCEQDPKTRDERMKRLHSKDIRILDPRLFTRFYSRSIKSCL